MTNKLGIKDEKECTNIYTSTHPLIDAVFYETPIAISYNTTNRGLDYQKCNKKHLFQKKYYDSKDDKIINNIIIYIRKKYNYIFLQECSYLLYKKITENEYIKENYNFFATNRPLGVNIQQFDSSSLASRGFPSSPAGRGVPSSPASRGFPSSPASRGFPSSPASRGFPSSPASRGVPSSPASRGVPSSSASRGVPSSPAGRGFPSSIGVPSSPASRGFPSSPAGRDFPSSPAVGISGLSSNKVPISIMTNSTNDYECDTIYYTTYNLTLVNKNITKINQVDIVINSRLPNYKHDPLCNIPELTDQRLTSTNNQINRHQLLYNNDILLINCHYQLLERSTHSDNNNDFKEDIIGTLDDSVYCALIKSLNKTNMLPKEIVIAGDFNKNTTNELGKYLDLYESLNDLRKFKKEFTKLGSSERHREVYTLLDTNENIHKNIINSKLISLYRFNELLKDYYNIYFDIDVNNTSLMQTDDRIYYFKLSNNSYNTKKNQFKFNKSDIQLMNNTDKEYIFLICKLMADIIKNKQSENQDNLKKIIIVLINTIPNKMSHFCFGQSIKNILMDLKKILVGYIVSEFDINIQLINYIFIYFYHLIYNLLIKEIDFNLNTFLKKNNVDFGNIIISNIDIDIFNLFVPQILSKLYNYKITDHDNILIKKLYSNIIEYYDNKILTTNKWYEFCYETLKLYYDEDTFNYISKNKILIEADLILNHTDIELLNVSDSTTFHTNLRDIIIKKLKIIIKHFCTESIVESLYFKKHDYSSIDNLNEIISDLNDKTISLPVNAGGQYYEKYMKYKIKYLSLIQNH